MTLGCANNMDLLFCLTPIKKHMSKTASVLDTGTSGSTPVGYHDLPWPSAASGTPGLLEPASPSIARRYCSCRCLCHPSPQKLGSEQDGPFSKTDILTQANMTLGRANARDLLVFLKPIKKLMGKTAVLDTWTSKMSTNLLHNL